DARPARGGGDRIRRRLGARRAAGPGQNTHGIAHLDSVHGGDQRRRDQCGAAAAVRRDPAPRTRSLRPPVPGWRECAPRDAHLDPPVSDRRAAPHPLSGSALRPHPRPRRRRDVDRGRDPRLVSRGDRADILRTGAMPAPRILLIGLGGTITMTRDASGTISPALSAADLVRAVPGLERVADIETTSPLALPGASLSIDDVLGVAALVDERLEGGADRPTRVQGPAPTQAQRCQRAL